MSQLPCIKPITPEDSKSIDDALNGALSYLIKYVPDISEKELSHHATMTEKNEEYVKSAERMAEEHPKFVPPTIDVEEWAEDIKAFDDDKKLIEKSKEVLNMLENHQRLAGARAREEFNNEYRCLAVLARDGSQEAKTYYDIYKEYYKNMFGHRPEKPCVEDVLLKDIEVISSRNKARKFVAANKDKLKGLLDTKLILEGEK